MIVSGVAVILSAGFVTRKVLKSHFYAIAATKLRIAVFALVNTSARYTLGLSL